MRERHHRGQSPARQYFYPHTETLRRALEFTPTPPNPQLDQFRRPITHTSLSTQKFTLKQDHFTYTKTATDGSSRGRSKQDENVKTKQN